jgi:hypothetical protein
MTPTPSDIRSAWLDCLDADEVAAGLDVPVASLPGRVTVVGRAGPQTIAQIPGTVTVAAYAGDDLAFDVQIDDADGAPFPIAGLDFAADIRVTPGAELAGHFHVTPVDVDTVRLWLDHDTSAALPLVCVYDLLMVDNDWRTTLIAGTLTITPRVTQWPA